MSDYPNYSLLPSRTPKSLKFLIFTTLAVSLLSALVDRFFPAFWGAYTPQALLSLSRLGILQGYFWQFLTYVFISPLPLSVSYSPLISLFFNAYLLWMIGTTLIERKGSFHFFCLYFFSGLISGGVGYAVQHYFPLLSLSGNAPALYAILMAWMILYSETELLLFMTLPVKGKWLVSVLIGASLFIDLTTGAWISAVSSATGALLGYLYAIAVWKVSSPFACLHALEKQWIALFTKNKPAPPTQAKIYEFRTGRAILREKEFLDAMVLKISKHGKQSLSWKERWRMTRIIKKKQIQDFIPK